MGREFRSRTLHLGNQGLKEQRPNRVRALGDVRFPRGGGPCWRISEGDMSPNIKAGGLPLPRQARRRRFHAQTGAATAKPRHSRAWWWWRGATCVSIAYIVASQALLDVPGWSTSAFVLAALLVALMVAGAVCRVWKLRLGKWLIIPALFLGYCLLRSFSGIQDTAPFNTFVQVVSAFAGGTALALALRVGVSFKAVVYAQVAANLLQILLVLSGLGPEPPPGQESFRYAGITGNPNVLALQLTLGACFIWLVPRKAGVFPCVFAVCAVAFAVAVTGSRKALLIGLFFLVLMLIQAVALVPKQRRRLMVTLAAACGCFTGLFLGHWIYQNGGEILAVQRTLDYEDSSFRLRAEMAEQGIQLWKQAPLFGNGLDAFRGLSGQGTYSHNNYVELLCDLGLLGALVFYSLHAQILVRAAQARPILRLYCWIFVVMLLLADLGYVSYASKQSVMILMFLTVVTTSRYGFGHRRHSAKDRGARRQGLKSVPRRFVMQN